MGPKNYHINRSVHKAPEDPYAKISLEQIPIRSVCFETVSHYNPGFSGTRYVTQADLELMTILLSAGTIGMNNTCTNSRSIVV